MDAPIKPQKKPRYSPHAPSHYPVSWSTAAKIALGKDGWVSVDWAKGEAGAVATMKRLRAFAKGITLFPGYLPTVADKLAGGYRMAFRKEFRFGVWDLQLRYVKVESLEETLTAALKDK